MPEVDINERVKYLEEWMARTDFWADKQKAQEVIRELRELKAQKEGVTALGRSGAIMTIFSGAGGDDAEDFSRMLLEMYFKFFKRRGLEWRVLHENQNDHGGYRNITLEISNPTLHPPLFKGRVGEGSGPYGILKNESGVHRLVRVSPFNAKKLRHTSFSMVEVIPRLPPAELREIPDEEIKVEFSKSGGPGGQNVNKRETAVRAVHLPTGLSAHVTSERSQEANRQKAVEILKTKLFLRRKAEHSQAESKLKISKTTDIEWGNQIRSYVLHPYKMVKDHRTGVETSDVKGVLEEGELDEFIEVEKNL